MKVNPHPDLDQVLHAVSIIEYCRDADKRRDYKTMHSNDPLYIMVGIMDWVVELQRLLYDPS